MKQFTAAILLATLGAQAARVLDNERPYISGEISSNETFQHGRFKTRIQGSDRKGTLASFLTLFTGNENMPLNAENWNHINLQLTPHKNNKVTTNLIWSGFTNWGETVQNFDPAQNWHEYEFTWTPDYVAFAIDGNEVRREDHTSERAENGVNAGVEDLNKDQRLVMGFWTPKWLSKHLESDQTMPWYARYDYVEAYDYMGKDSSGQDMFELRFRDDFDTLDTERWRQSTHTIEDSTAKFVPANAYVEDGMLVLKLERADGSSGNGPDHNKPKKPTGDFHVLPPPVPHSLDRAIETTTRVVTTIVRTYLDDWSENMSHHLLQ